MKSGQSKRFRTRLVPATATLTLTTFAPDVYASQFVFDPKIATPATKALTLTTYAPTVTSSSAQLVTPATASLALTTFAPTITASSHQRVVPATASLTLTSHAPTVTGSGNQVAIPATRALTLTTFAPTVVNPQRVIPATKSLTITTFAPTITVTGTSPQVVIPATKALILTTFAPTVTAPANVVVTPPKRTLTITRYAPTVTVTGGATGYPPDTTLTNPTPPAAPAIPALNTPTAMATWGTTITRISNVSYQRNLYSRAAGWNAAPSGSAQSMILLPGYNGAPAAVVSGVAPYTFMHNLPFLVGMSQWSNVNPNKIWGTWVEENYLRSQTYNGGSSWTLNVEYVFSGYTSISLGDSEGGLSDDDKTVVLMGVTTGGAQNIIVFDTQTKTIVATRTLPMRPDTAFISRSGNYVLVYWSTGDGPGATQGLQQYDRNLNYIRQLTQWARHGDVCRLADGSEVWAQVAFGGEFYRLDNGAQTYIFGTGQPFPYNNAFTVGHLSGRAVNRNGWVTLSQYNYPATFPGSTYGRDQVVVAKLDNTGTVEVFGWSYHRANGDTAAGYPTSPFATPSRDGRLQLIGTEWGDTTEPYGPVYAYVLEQL